MVEHPEVPFRLADPARRPSSRAPWSWALGSLLFWLLPTLGAVAWALGGSWGAPERAVSAAAVVALAFVFVVIAPIWRYQVHRWDVGGEAVYTRVGWLTQERRIVPISRVQTVDTQRGPVQRLLGLSTVTVTTASSRGAVKIEQLDRQVADELVARLTEIAAANSQDAT